MGEHRDYHQEYYSGGLGSRDNRTGRMYSIEPDRHPQSGNNQTIRENQTPAADEHEDTDSFSPFWSARMGEHLQNPSSQSDRHDTADHPSNDHLLRDVKIQQRQAIKNREDYRVKELTHDYDTWDEKEQLRRYEERQELERWRKEQQKLRHQKAESERRRQHQAANYREFLQQEMQDKEKKEKEHMWREREGVMNAESESRKQDEADMRAAREHRERQKQEIQDKKEKEEEHARKEREGVIDTESESRKDEADIRAVRDYREPMYRSSLRGDFESSSGVAAEVEGQSHSSIVLDSGPINSGGTDQWECERCTFLNTKENRECEMCDIPRERKTEVAGNYGRPPPAKYVGTGEHPQEIPFDYGRRVYHVLSGTSSQYTVGAVSACTTIALQAVHSILNALTDSRFPYGCSPALIDDIVRLGSTYKGDFHQDLDEVLKTRRDLTAHGEKGIRPVGSMVDVSPQNPVPGLRRGLEWNRSLKANVACVLTCQAQSICVVYVYSPSLSPHTDSDVKFILFDSHSRQHNGVNYGACLLFFNSLDDVCHYIQLLFPSIDMPALSIQSEFEQAQYAAITVGQADFFCLNRSWSMRPDAMLQSNSSTPLEEFQRSGSICSSTGYQTPGNVQYSMTDQFDRERFRAIELARNQATEREEKLLADNRALQVALSCEKDEHIKTKETMRTPSITVSNTPSLSISKINARERTTEEIQRLQVQNRLLMEEIQELHNNLSSVRQALYSEKEAHAKTKTQVDNLEMALRTVQTDAQHEIDYLNRQIRDLKTNCKHKKGLSYHWR